MYRLSAFLCKSMVSTAVIGGARPLGTYSQHVPCADVTVLREDTFATLPKSSQQAIWYAVRPSIQAIVDDKGMGVEGTVVSSVPLSAVRFSRGSRGNALYIVSWDNKSFGVNRAIWVVELTPTGAKNLVPLRRGQSSGYSLGGFGFEVLSPKTERYPELLIASKGFKDGGGAEAEGVCLRKTGEYYEDVECPVTCHANLNSR